MQGDTMPVFRQVLRQGGMPIRTPETIYQTHGRMPETKHEVLMVTHERYRIEGDTYAFGTDDIGLRMALAFNLPITETYIANKVFDDEICAEEEALFEWELLGRVVWSLFERL